MSNNNSINNSIDSSIDDSVNIPIDKMEAINVALELINDLSSPKTTIEDIYATLDYIHSIEDFIPIEITLQLYVLISHFEVFQRKLNNNF